MKNELTAQQIQSYQKNGFLIIPDFLTSTELTEWRRCTDEAVSERLGDSIDQMTNQMNPDDFYAQVFTQCLRLSDTHQGIRQLIHDPRIGQMVANLAGEAGMRVWHDQALIKPPHGNPTAWHLDVPYWSFDSRNALSFWVALDDATLANGCLWYIPGSHRQASYNNVGIGQNLGALFQMYPDWKSIPPQSGHCSAGSMVLHNGLTAHAAGANMTIHNRRAITCAFMPDGSTFNGKKNILPQDYFDSLEVGDLLNDEEQNTLVWHQSWTK